MSLATQRPLEAADEVYCVLVPVAEERLLLPRSCVLEVVNYRPPERIESAPPWLLGLFDWNGRRLPLVSFEAACGRALPEASGRARVVILQGVSGLVPGGHFALLALGFPQHVRVNPEVVKPDPSRAFGERAPVLCQVRMINEYPLIPDLERLEQMVSEESRAG